jgi:DNA polymerase elongation subunit (family B)
MNISEIHTDELVHLDFDSLSKEELVDVIKQLENEALVYDTLQMASKICLNSIYGALGNEYFYFFDVRLAETITLQGQDAIKYSENVLNSYFFKHFHKDKVALKALKEVCPDINIENLTACEQPVVVYIDTDSCYVTFQEAMAKVNWTGHVNDFVLTLNAARLESYLKGAFDKYSKYYNSDNYLMFELESIAYHGIWTAKKKYVQEMAWSDGKIYEPLQKIKATGLEMIQASTPAFCRSILSDIVKWMFKTGNGFKISDLAKELSAIKKQFMISDIDDISKNTSIGDYEKFITNDMEYLKIEAHCPAHIKGAGVHNHLLNKNPALRNTYDLLRSGDKVKWYYTTHEKFDKFSYLRGEYPREFALPIDYDTQFEKTLLGPVNNIIESMSYKPLTANLHTAKKLF